MGNFKNASGVLSLILPTVLASCATAVTFNVTHPPLIDLRGVNSITVIPFEWDAGSDYENLSRSVTSALISGAKKGIIDFVDPHPLQNAGRQQYWKYADVYITGRISNVSAHNYTETREEKNYWGQIIKRYFITRTVAVTIEYSYIRSVDNQVLGYFRKQKTDSATFERSGGRHAMRRERLPGVFRQRGTRTEGIAISAIWKFANTMEQELGPWATTEKRTIKGRAGKGPQPSEAKKSIRQKYYDNAIDIYNALYDQTGNSNAGYNAAVLLEANDNFPRALELLEQVYRGILASGKKSPSFITREVQKIKSFMNGFKILETYKKEEVSHENFYNDKMLKVDDVG